ncbi:uncharacterized protein J4E78_004770 [Alternaria triticimaculans]|uniref:uncharacterized protein n=1 Tax=Alternaria triticimaculans TaxID=297637 RepID=UPI0020C53440|nr:uncharacterized protein J4E78_004770 [Alternaria triticimaculans]KAI4661980.1 hypothetical protein J4E78_004770 [Alternaria triticimaculans]
MEQALKAEVNNLTVADAFIYRLAADLYWISGPSARLGRIAGAVIGSGERLQFESPTSHQNTSYETQNFLPLLKCDTANSTVREDVWRLVNDTEVDTAWVHNMTAGSLKWATSEHSGEVGYLGTIYPRRLEGGNSGGLTWNETESTTRHYVFAIQRQPTELEYQSDTEYLSCVLWNASVSYTVKKQNGIVAIGDIHREYINEFEPLEAYVDDRSACSICEGSGAPAYSGYSIALSKYLLGYIAWNQDNTRHRYLTVGSLGTTSLSTGAQFYNMNRNMNEAGLVIGTIQNPSNVRNISFREDVEAFALNLSLSIINDASLCTSGQQLKANQVKEALGDSQARVAQPLNNKTAKIKLRFDAKEGFVLGKRRQASES